MLSEFLTMICDVLSGIPFVGGLYGQICERLIELLSGLGL